MRTPFLLSLGPLEGRGLWAWRAVPAAVGDSFLEVLEGGGAAAAAGQGLRGG